MIDPQTFEKKTYLEWMQEQVGESKLVKWGYFGKIRLMQVDNTHYDLAMKNKMKKEAPSCVAAMTVKEEDGAK